MLFLTSQSNPVTKLVKMSLGLTTELRCSNICSYFLGQNFHTHPLYRFIDLLRTSSMAWRVCSICVPLAAAGQSVVPASCLWHILPLSYVCMYKAGRTLIGDSLETACLPRGGYFTPCSALSAAHWGGGGEGGPGFCSLAYVKRSHATLRHPAMHMEQS